MSSFQPDVNSIIKKNEIAEMEGNLISLYYKESDVNIQLQAI